MNTSDKAYLDRLNAGGLRFGYPPHAFDLILQCGKDWSEIEREPWSVARIYSNPHLIAGHLHILRMYDDGPTELAKIYHEKVLCKQVLDTMQKELGHQNTNLPKFDDWRFFVYKYTKNMGNDLEEGFWDSQAVKDAQYNAHAALLQYFDESLQNHPVIDDAQDMIKFYQKMVGKNMSKVISKYLDEATTIAARANAVVTCWKDRLQFVDDKLDIAKKMTFKAKRKQVYKSM